MNEKEREVAEAAMNVARMAVGPTAIARVVGVTQPAVSQWTVCPAERVLAVEKATGVSRHLLRPDIYPKEG